MNRILVGVDTSDESVRALQQAVEQARAHNAALEVLYVFAPPEQMSAFPVPPPAPADIEQRRQEYTDRLGAWLDNLDVDLSGLDVTWSVIADRRPSRALVERSAHADLVVVAARGRGGFKGLKLGGVTEQVTRHAKAPVLVVRHNA